MCLLINIQGEISMKKERRLTIGRGVKYLPILIILLSISIMIGSTFAYFTDTKGEEGSLTFSKVELSNETTIGINGVLKDVLPGTPITNGPLSFSKSIDSEPIYVRAKVSFSLSEDYKNDSEMIEFLDNIRNSMEFNIETDEQHDAVWSTKQGNYYYLLDFNDNTKLKKIDTIDTYLLSEQVIIPRDLQQIEGNYQYMKSINFHIAFEALQADNLSNDLDEIKSVFNEVFPGVSNEIYIPTYKLVFKGVDQISNYLELEVKEGGIIEEPSAPTHSDPSAKFEGWYIEKTHENKFDFTSNINGHFTLYPLYTLGETITFMGPDNIEILQSSTVGKGETVKAPILDLPADQDGTQLKAVEGWYTDSSYGTRFDFSTVIDSSFTLYPKIVDASSNLAYTEVLDETNTVVAYSVAMGECNDLEVVIPAFYKGLPVTHITHAGFNGRSDITKVILPEIVTYIDGFAFSNCTNLSLDYLPSNLEYIGGSAFQMCDNLTISSIPESVTYIGSYAFSACYNMVIDKLPDNITTIEDCAFQSCNKIKLSKLPDGITSIGDRAFWSCYEITLTTLPDMVTRIGVEAFEGCQKLALIKLPNRLMVVEDEAFNECVALELAELPQNLTSIGNYAFNNCYNIGISNIPNSVEFIGDFAFTNCQKLNVSTMSNNIVNIGDNVFTNTPYFNNPSNWINNILYMSCDSGDKVVLDSKSSININIIDGSILNNVKVIADKAFENCDSITGIVIPNTVIRIGESAFVNCINLNSISISSSVESIGVDSITNTAYYNTASNWVSDILIIKFNDSDNKIVFKMNKESTVTEVGLDIMKNVVIIAPKAFDECRNLQKIVIPNGVKVIEEYTFNNCSSLAEISFEENSNLEEIKSWAFTFCVITKLEIPESVKNIAIRSIYSCFDLVSIWIKGNNTHCAQYFVDNGTPDYIFVNSQEIAEIIKPLLNSFIPERLIYVLDESFDPNGKTIQEYNNGHINGRYNSWYRIGEEGSYRYYKQMN